MEKKRTIYIAGPMLGIVNDNMEEFVKSAAILRMYGWEVISPVEISYQVCYSRSCKLSEIPYEEWLEIDLQRLEKADALFMLDGWEKSNGAKGEMTSFISQGKEEVYFQANGYPFPEEEI